LVLLSHDHFDHLDYRTILSLKHKTSWYCVPLGVPDHLIKWGIQSSRIIELNWWEKSTEIPGLMLIATPSRHFSGRVGFKMDYTLWCSWVIEYKNMKIFFCGDSGYSDHFKLIGEKYGPFELTMMECGQYNEGWPFIHMNPEEAVHAHIDLKGEKMIPIHWGKFKLSLHSWREPIERAIKEAERLNVNLVRIKPGEIIKNI
jgi:L-ascorbate metabolism protein UlaG (beta-lactamase superfamily)